MTERINKKSSQVTVHLSNSLIYLISSGSPQKTPFPSVNLRAISLSTQFASRQCCFETPCCTTAFFINIALMQL